MAIEFETKIAKTFFLIGAEEIRVAAESSNISWRLELPVADVDLPVEEVLEHDVEVRIVVNDHLLCERPERREASWTILVDGLDWNIGSGQHHEH